MIAGLIHNCVIHPLKAVTHVENTHRSPDICILSANAAQEIRASWVPYKVTARMLAARFNVAEHVVRRVLSGDTWSS